MAAHRYWRASNLTPYGGPTVELSEFWLLNGETRVDAPATLTSSVAPVSGTLSSLRDHNTVTAASLARGTALTWDFGGSPADVTDIRVGSTLSTEAFLATAVLSWSDDGVAWTTLSSFIGIAWPGHRQLTESRPKGRWIRGWGTMAPIFSSGGLGVTLSAVNSGGAVLGPRSNSSDKLQFEIIAPSDVANINMLVGVATDSYAGEQPLAYTAGAWAWRASGQFLNQGTDSTYGAGFASGDVVGVVLNVSTGTLEFFKNGVSQGLVPTTLPTGVGFHPALGKSNNIASSSVISLKAAEMLYPVAGATPWEAGWEPVLTGLVSTPQSNTIPPATPQPARYDRVATPGPMRALANFFFDPYARGRIVGTVKRKGTPDNVPLARRVRLYRDVDGLLVAETWSNAAGDFVFENIEENVSYTTIAYDYEHNYRAIAADNLNLANGAVELMR